MVANVANLEPATVHDLDESDFIPSPARLVDGLRDTGYSYEASFADIVDNSIAANANKVDIKIYRMADGELRVVIADNGDGMDLTTLLNAMRYGSPKRHDPKSLGKFGMGLKTASTAFCRKLTVFSIKNGECNGRAWDIEEIKRLDRWVLLTPDHDEYEEDIDFIGELSDKKTGTVVIWEDIDRLISHSEKDSKDKLLAVLVAEIRDHLSSVFGKFLDKDNTDAANVEIFVNDEPLEGWDPTGKWMNSGDGKRVTIQKKVIDYEETLNEEVSKLSFELNGYILPNKSDMTDEELNKIRYGNDNQGFYIYRENRLIYGGGWPHRLFTKEPHLNLLRVELNFDHELDDFFQVDIRKTRIIFPQALRQKIKKHLTPFRNEANKRYRQGRNTPKAEGEENYNQHKSSDNAIRKHLSDNAQATLTITDHEKGEVNVKNQFGNITLTHAHLVEGTDISVQVCESLTDGCLWEYGINEEGDVCVLLNESHEFYKKFYTPNFNNPVLIQSMDSVFWSLANCEIGTISEKSRRNIEEMRFMVSKNLRILSDELPDVED
ncbi:MAG: ATP-binding protein [Alphaproteobacteria bacterium]|nr:ATP-binding protein [Alphaproteobacteria bacterium]NCQ87371.1 ATP-binding protein [Alphaproteobacteria bacterium]NCT06242.1 ATP-binding protein [Alphaproteobacteria bacterium]